MKIIVTIEYTPAKWFDDALFTDKGIKENFEEIKVVQKRFDLYLVSPI